MNRNVIKVYKNSYSELIKVVDFLIISIVYFSLIILTGHDTSVLDVAIGILLPVIFFIISTCAGFYHLEFNSTVEKIAKKVTFNIVVLALVMFLLRTFVQDLNGIDDIVENENVIYLTFVISFVFIFSFRLALSKIKISNPKIAILGLTPAGIYIESGLIKQYGRSIIKNIGFYDDRRRSIWLSRQGKVSWQCCRSFAYSSK
ncbi:hypothetical protein [Vibrio rumoiensis]|uniref:hypothetical protein n=1 Tax=Vibrio rumoiensis TaxID=76258 RepID=UPI003AA965FB